MGYRYEQMQCFVLAVKIGKRTNFLRNVNLLLLLLLFVFTLFYKGNLLEDVRPL